MKPDVSGLGHRTLKTVFLLVAAGLVACTPALHKPEVTLTGIELLGLGLSEQQFVMKLRVINPNALELPVEELQFDIEIEGRHFAHGTTTAPVTIPGNGEATLDIMALSRLGNLSKPVREALKEGRTQLAYRLAGQAELGKGIGRVPLTKSGTIPLSMLEKWRAK